MKCSAFSLMLMFSLNIFTQCDYETLIEHQAQEWKNSYVTTLHNQHHLQTLINVILLSYQIAQESCTMLTAKLIAQEELLKIYTPSLNDSWHTNMQVINNDTSKLEQALENIKKSQANFQTIFALLKKVGPEIIQINPQPTQTIIHDLKHALMIWGKQQYEMTEELSQIQEEFSSAIATISDIKIMFQAMVHTPEFKNCHLKEAAGYVAKTNKDIELVFSHVIQVRKSSIMQIQKFFSVFFKTYYSMLYNLLTTEQQTTFITSTTINKKLPRPDAFFE